jgi:arginyl-tRNA synthetase
VLLGLVYGFSRNRSLLVKRPKEKIFKLPLFRLPYRKYSPHLLCTYLHKLAQEFNAYYDKAPILKAEGDLRTLRLAIVEKVRTTLTQGVQMLGFQEVERM